jgi:hypothetical protein
MTATVNWKAFKLEMKYKTRQITLQVSDLNLILLCALCGTLLPEKKNIQDSLITQNHFTTTALYYLLLEFSTRNILNISRPLQQ